MSFWGWVQAIATGWFVLSILLAVAWALGGKRIFRKPPAPPRAVVEPEWFNSRTNGPNVGA
jgi:hypothetical protein